MNAPTTPPDAALPSIEDLQSKLIEASAQEKELFKLEQKKAPDEFLPTGSANQILQTDEEWIGIPGIEISKGGRIFITWFTGGAREPDSLNYILVAWSNDGGRSWIGPVCLASPEGKTRACDPCLWMAPTGELWLFINRGNRETGLHEVRARICKDPDAAVPEWGPEFLLELNVPYAFRLNKPIVLQDGSWILPLTLATQKIMDWFAGPLQRHGVGISVDEGRTWTSHGCLEAPEWAFENMVVQRRDGSLWMLIRTGGGVLWESFSSDGGRTWAHATPTLLKSPGSRFFIRRLASGNLLLINHFNFVTKGMLGKGMLDARNNLTAQISTDDGATWNNGLLLDERHTVSYPDAIQEQDGLIRVIYDRDRFGAGELLMAAFHEEDVIGGSNVSGQVVLKHCVHRRKI